MGVQLSFKEVLKYALYFLVAFALIYWVYQGQDLDSLLENLSAINPVYVIASVLISLPANFARSERWRVLFKPLGYSPGHLTPFLAIELAYFANALLPRFGELARCGFLQKSDAIPVEKSLGTVVTERVFDFIIFLFLFGIVFFFIERERFGELVLDLLNQNQDEGVENYSVLLFSIVISLFFLTISVFLIFRRRILELSLVKKAIAFILGLKDGVLSIFRLKKKASTLFLFHTLLIWGCYWISTYLLVQSNSYTNHLGWSEALSLMVIGGLGIIIPTPGGIGSYHFLVSSLLMVYGVEKEQSLALTAVMHGAQMIGFMVFGSLAFLASIVFIGASGSKKKTKLHDNDKQNL